MATKKKTPSKTDAAGDKPGESKHHSEAYEAALGQYEQALELVRGQKYEQALGLLGSIAELQRDEPELADRARTYSELCRRKLAPAAEAPATVEEKYLRAVVLTNERRLDEAIALLDEAAREEPTNVSVLYTRASARALQGNTEAVVTDLRQAILVDPTVRYQAVNDPDFEKVRDDAAFIDLIEPGTGA